MGFSPELEKIALTYGQRMAVGGFTGAAIGGGLGYLGSDKQTKVTNTVVGALSGGIIGLDTANEYNRMSRFSKNFRGHQSYGGHGFYTRAPTDIRDLHKAFGLTGKETTKAEVRNAWKVKAKQHHPDVGGNAEMFKKVNNQFEELEKTPWFQKLSMAMYMKVSKELLVGGKADGKSDSKFDKKQIEMGIKVEREHIKDEKARKEVAKDHLVEDPKYYTHLKEMENKYVKKAFEIGFEKKV